MICSTQLEQARAQFKHKSLHSAKSEPAAHTCTTASKSRGLVGPCAFSAVTSRLVMFLLTSKTALDV